VMQRGVESGSYWYDWLIDLCVYYISKETTMQEL
jgi:hypothetical protein